MGKGILFDVHVLIFFLNTDLISVAPMMPYNFLKTELLYDRCIKNLCINIYKWTGCLRIEIDVPVYYYKAHHEFRIMRPLMPE